MSDEKYDLWRDDAIAEARDSAAALESDGKRAAKKFEEDGEQVQERRNCFER